MKNQILLIISSLIFSSCATLNNKRTMNINVYSDTDSVKLCVNNDTSRLYNLPASFEVERSKNDLKLSALKDGNTKNFFIESHLSSEFWLGNLFCGGLFAYLIDLTNQKRFTYPTNITLNFKDSIQNSANNYSTLSMPSKNSISLKLTIPEGNHFYLNKGSGYGSEFGFLGISGGLEYYFAEKNSIEADFGVIINFIIPVPAPYDPYYGHFESVSASYGDIQIGTNYKRLHYSVGLQYNRTSYYESDSIELNIGEKGLKETNKNQNNFGFTFSTYYRICNGFALGLKYFPSFISWDNNIVQKHYSHLLFLELIFSVNDYRK